MKAGKNYLICRECTQTPRTAKQLLSAQHLVNLACLPSAVSIGTDSKRGDLALDLKTKCRQFNVQSAVLHTDVRNHVGIQGLLKFCSKQR